jgi:hypothetical protein
MPKRDFFQVAFQTVQQAAGLIPKPPEPKASAVKGGKVRAEKLSPKRRKEIAQKAAKARWGS